MRAGGATPRGFVRHLGERHPADRRLEASSPPLTPLSSPADGQQSVACAQRPLGPDNKEESISSDLCEKREDQLGDEATGLAESLHPHDQTKTAE